MVVNNLSLSPSVYIIRAYNLFIISLHLSYHISFTSFLSIYIYVNYQAPNLKNASNSQLSKSKGSNTVMSNGSYMLFLVIKSADLSSGLLPSRDVSGT
jgi:hypothetical protein